MKEQVNELLRKIGLKAVEVKLEQIMTADGQAALEAEVFEAGQPVFIVNEDERIPLPVGEYAMADDMILKVVEEGIIASYEKKEMEAEEPAAEEVVEEEVEVEASTKPTAKKVVESVSKETYFAAEEKAPSKISEEEKAEIIGEIKKLILEEIPSILEDMKKDEEKEEEVKEQTELSKPIQHNPENAQPRQQISFNKKEQSLKSMVYDLISK